LGGNARTSIIINASPNQANIAETISSLRFGDRAASIRNIANVNVVSNVADLNKELKKVKEEHADLLCAYQRLESEVNFLRKGSAAMAKPILSESASFVSSCSSDIESVEDWALREDEEHVCAKSGICAEVEDRQQKHARKLSLSSNQCKGYRRVNSPQSPDTCSGSSRSSNSSIDLFQLAAKQNFMRGLLPSLLCPLTHEVMRDPVFASDGYTYNRGAIEHYFAAANGLPVLSPMTDHNFVSKELVPNMMLRKQIRLQLADLPLPQARMSTFEQVGIYQLQLIFSFLDFLSLTPCFPVSAGFFSVGSQQGRCCYFSAFTISTPPRHRSSTQSSSFDFHHISMTQSSSFERAPSLPGISGAPINEISNYLADALSALVEAEQVGKN
jgi:hypothetical protein